MTHIIVLPVGKDTEHVSNLQSAQQQTVDYIYIDNMESYVTNVLNGNQRVDLRRMTPEQREEYRIVREALATEPVEEPSQAEQASNTEAGDPENTEQTSAETTGN